MTTPAAGISRDTAAFLRAMIQRMKATPKIRPQPATQAKLAQLMVRANFFPHPHSLPSEFRGFERALRIEREGFRPEQDSAEKKELFVCHKNSREYSDTAVDGVVIKRKFCVHHDSSHYGPLILKLWNEIRAVITKASELVNWMYPEELGHSHGLQLFKNGIERILEIIETGFLNVYEEEHFDVNVSDAEWNL
jgi:hypothetical protein